MPQNSLTLPVILVAAGTIGFTEPARSDETTDLLNDTASLSVGTFLLSTNTRVTLNGSAGQPGTEVNLGRDLGFKDTNRFRVDGTWRFFKRHKLRVMYFNTNNHADKVITRDLDIGDTTYPVNANLHSDHSTTIVELAYEYAFWRGDTYEVTASAGVHAVQFKFGVSGNGNVNGQTEQFSAESATTNAPLPVIGMHGLWEFKPKWYFDGQAQYFSVKVDNVDGYVSDVRAGVTRMFGAHIGIGAGWNQFITRVSIDKRSFEGSLRWRYSGALLYLTGAF